MSAIIRQAIPSDYPALCLLWAELDRLHAALQPTFFRPPAGPRCTEAELARSLAHEDQAVLVAEEDGEVVGMVQCRVYDTPNHPMMVQRRRAYVEDLVVLREHRQAGLGRALMESVASFARQRGAGQIMLTVWEGNEASAFYRGLGYSPVSEILGLEL